MDNLFLPVKESSGASVYGCYNRIMETLFPDTRPEVTESLLELLRKASPARKLLLVGQMNETVKLLALSGLRLRHPDDPPELLRRRLADLVLGPELAFKAYGPYAPIHDRNAP
jgi:hypothetical protein